MPGHDSDAAERASQNAHSSTARAAVNLAILATTAHFICNALRAVSDSGEQ